MHERPLRQEVNAVCAGLIVIELNREACEGTGKIKAGAHFKQVTSSSLTLSKMAASGQSNGPVSGMIRNPFSHKSRRMEIDSSKVVKYSKEGIVLLDLKLIDPSAAILDRECCSNDSLPLPFRSWNNPIQFHVVSG